LREADDCERYAISETIHGYSTSRGLRVLDVGCGNGYVLFHYARHGTEVTGVVLTKAAFEMSRKRFALGGLPGGILGV
jgi:cyclopropane fatty-acyl-phospholipid synthase-like methyltransferase